MERQTRPKDMELWSNILGLILTWALIRTVYSIMKTKPISGKLPPGPKPLPIIGNLHQLGDKPHKTLAELAKIHGPLMSLKLGQVTAIVVSSSTMAKEVLQTHDQYLSNRTIPDALHIHGHENFGFPWIPVSNLWRSYRKICNTQLFSVKALDTNQKLRRRKVRELFEEMKKRSSSGEAVDIGSAAFTTSLNLLSNTIFSVDLADPESELAREFKEVTWNIMKEAATPNLSDYFPLLKKIDPLGIKRRMKIHFRRLLDIFEGMINQRLKLRESPDSVRNDDILDILLNIVEENNDEINRIQIVHLLLVLFVAGTDTTASTLQWAMAELLRNPEILSKARAELDEIIGKGNPVEECDVSRLPYLQAIMKETFRVHGGPFLLPRKAEKDVEIGGFTIPKGAQIMVNMWAIGRDKDIWEDPNTFKPERFLGLEIDVRGRSFELLPFGAGRRICPGLPLALRMLPLMMGTLIHSFDWKLDNGLKPKDVDMNDKFGITLQMAQPLRAVPIHA